MSLKKSLILIVITYSLQLNIQSQCNFPCASTHNYYYCNNDKIDPTHPYPVPWMVIVYDKNGSGPANVEVDYFDLYLHQNGKDIPLKWESNLHRNGGKDCNCSNDKYDDTNYEGGWHNKLGELYKLTSDCDDQKWFKAGYIQDIFYNDNIGVTIKNGIITWPISDYKDAIWHPVSQIYPNIKVDGDGYILINAKFKINGPATVMVGLDYYDDENCAKGNHYEVGASDWYCQQDTWIDATVRFDHKETAKK